MTAAAPTIFAVESDAAWVVVLAVSLVTVAGALLFRRLIKGAGGLASGLLVSLPLLLPPLAAIVFQGALLPEVAVLRPARDAFHHGTREFLHLLLFRDGNAVTPYVAWGSARNWALLAGVGISSFMLLRRAVGCLLVRRMVARCLIPPEEVRVRLEEMTAAVARSAGLDRVPQILLLPPGIEGAFAVGAFRPRILVSCNLLTRLDDHEVEAVIAHEVAHLRARDIQVVSLSGMLRDVVAWNPVAQFAYRRLVDDREREADRRAAELTGRPLAVASGLLKMCDLVKDGRRGPRRAALAFLRPGGRVARRVSDLLAMADGRSEESGDRRIPYLAAACVVAVLGLQAAASLTAERGAFAIVWGAPSAGADTYAPKAAPQPKAEIRRGGKKKAQRAELESPQRDLAARGSFRAEDMGRWLKQMDRLAAQGVTPATLQWEARRDWQAVPIRCTVGSLCIYRVDGI
ncbi:MAG TPA: M56 family metallopeptidase [Actinomycetota bacterium]|nr:M56 family metallopeptidase [Actinomycetota bacterium]